jgi:hypothetical protein
MSGLPKERRRSKRNELDLPLRFRMFLPSHRDEDSTAFLPGRIYDISKHGISLLTNTVEHRGLHIFHPNITSTEQCLLEIEIPKAEGNLVLRGKVVWYDRASPGDPFSFRAGVEFVDQTPELVKEVQALVRQAGQGKG